MSHEHYPSPQSVAAAFLELTRYLRAQLHICERLIADAPEVRNNYVMPPPLAAGNVTDR